MSNTQSSSTSPSHGKLIAVVVAAALVIVLALLSAFIWPGWALNKSAGSSTQQTNGTTSSQNSTSKEEEEPTTPSIKATALPSDATELLKAMPDSVLNYARTKAEASTSWTTASPLEEYTVTYSTGDSAKDVTLIVAQWSTADSAKKQYAALSGALTGEELGAGTVKVSGKATGSYTAKVDANDDAKAIAVWQNDTAVFQVTGAKAAVERFYQSFPL
ncbi:hypothetical protein DSM100688_1184 [Bifidobacterium ramosum]|uniref:Uncharacterized protein n=1 Tax=Bifidobacterium ramosum TaxID=1798158 RepID=A0A6L4X2U9_9BIFI|nr:hypothetical protein [Bifidobacterium ramosum]KAB8288074.1 hypothetical protein DSM100688_1184 [Bifidobacterium ramosum]NEG72706.1 hypothetical protein [Bifidobacterium ramosum]